LAVVLIIGGVIGTVLLTAFTGAQRSARLQGERVAVVEARRVAATILAAELRYLAPDADLHDFARDLLALRAFRGTAVVCKVEVGTVCVVMMALGGPLPAKVWLLRGGGGAWGGGSGGAAGAGHPTAAALLASATAAAGCPLREGESLHRWTLDPMPEPGTLLLLFESGSYHLTGNALRYRRGESGRQPLTAELFDDHAVGWHWIMPAGEGDHGGWGGMPEELPGEETPGSESAAAAIELVLAARAPGYGLLPAGQQRMRYWLWLRNGGQR
jgi:hypothetical protein